ncbi:uncharacterized protein LOC113214705 [Frankliniella occidentalis]|uniref:Uncharacterized protein LOC113214705 n=1 Tax=Frankliniella occidentalis TaxID=133901 RepID=A0A6J1TE06_FRAOC|nr:uncharacterized protein LOC113214705 [Frankliniella occidentalis]XP_026289945.1 uncharacterized protein LOC113214705 [Frankliniella occidentalis]XP_026289946.1 uncharacterized protein LOC113214705 [Frankliniella occidentalis]XP_026289947.1 uncharacterized protein LOC113214705 [Frankliniella occidentalis]
MENADALDLSKENIQPLKRGRNTTQLGLALQAQTDSSLHQMLSKKQEWYEMQIRTYEGSDPLELWCDYISWVEQSFPKHGPEGNLSVLLTKCFQAFKDEEKYKNDSRFVGLWIKYIEMQNDAKRVELYQLLHTQGIGVKCAEFYQSWAYEFQSVGDWKQADQIFTKGSMYMAQPAEELHAAHQLFLSSFVFNHKNINNETPEDDVGNHLQGDHRMPMAALKAIGKKSVAPTVRVGSNVRSQLPGVIPAVQGSSGRSAPSSRTFGVRGNNAGPVTVYQEHGEPEGEVLHSQNVSSALPIAQTINKENVVKAGPWTGQGLGSRKHHVTNAGNSFMPKQPGFEVHKDEENASSGHELRSHGIVVPNALQPRKGLEDGFHDAIAIFEEPNPFTKPMYRKNEVYAGGKELQLEELRALDYFKKRAEKNQKMREMSVQHGQLAMYERKFMSHNEPSVSLGVTQENLYPREEKPAPYYADGHGLDTLSDQPFRQAGPSPSPANSLTSTLSGYQQPQPQSLYRTALSSEGGAHSSGHLSHHEQPHMSHRFPPSNQSVHNQSMTLHTKLAMNEVQDLWGSPTIVKAPNSGPNLAASATPNMYQPAFQIMKDDSLPHQVHENSLLRSGEPQTFPHNHQAVGTVSQTLATAQQHPVMTSNNFTNPTEMYEDPMTGTSFMKQRNGFQVFQESSYTPPDPPVLGGKFQVFCDGDPENNVPSHTPILDRGNSGNLSISAHTSGSIEKVAKEKENLHKFPQADIELMEECGVTPAPDSTGTEIQQGNHFHITPSAYSSHAQNQSNVFVDQGHVQISSAAMVTHEPMHLAPPDLQEPMQTNSLPAHNMQSAPSVSYVYSNHAAPYSAMQPTPPVSHCSAPLTPEVMEDDAPVAAAPQYGVNMSETGITEAFFFPQMAAASTPFQASPKKSRGSKNVIDFNSSLYRVEQSWPEDDGADGSNQSSDSPKTVPPLKLFRIKNDVDQLSAILETSKEKYQSMLSTGSRNSLSSSINSKYGKYTTQKQSMGPQPGLNQIEESSEHSSSSSQEGLGQVQVQVQPQAQVQAQPQPQGPDSQVMHEMGLRVAKGEINPFDSRILEYFLHHIGFPLPQHAEGYNTLNGAVPARRNNCLTLNGDVYTVGKVLGEGAYAKVLKGVDTRTQKDVALKIQKPGCRWEYYICREIQHRLSQRDLVSAFMPADQIYVYSNGSVIVTDLLPFGTLLNLVNKVVASTKRPMQEPQVLFLLEQLISAVQALHACKIIHGDLKPDNILMRTIPAVNQAPCIQLIDFGRSIDMNLMPPGTTFNQVVMTDTFTCIEMRTGKPWTYQTDLFGLANTAHCLIFGDYMKVQESRTTGRWAIQTKLARNMNADFWGSFFDTLLNVESCDSMPDLEILRSDAQACMNTVTQLGLSVSALGRILLNR